MVIVADGCVVAEHVRLSGKGRTAYDWQHYVPLVQRKPSALRNGAPFVDLPEPLAKLRQALLRHAGGDRLMAQVLALEHAGPSGRVSPEHVANVLARLTAPERPPNVDTQLSPTTPVQADPGLYDRLRNLAGQEVEQEIDHR